MQDISRRGFLAVSSAAALAGCVSGAGGNGVGTNAASQIDARVSETQRYLYSSYPGTRDLANRAKGVLFIPLMTEAGLIGFGGAYGRGSLQINGTTVDYYSASRASVGPQIGAQQYAHALFFMTDGALADFRRSSGWAVGADIRYATPDQGGSLGKETTEIEQVIALVFGQQGLLAGATLGGVKYTRIIP